MLNKIKNRLTKKPAVTITTAIGILIGVLIINIGIISHDKRNLFDILFAKIREAQNVEYWIAAGAWFSTILIIPALLVLSYILITHKKKYNWKNYPLISTQFGYAAKGLRELRQFYQYVSPEPYPNITYVGQLFEHMGNSKSNQIRHAPGSWFSEYKFLIDDIMLHIHADVHTERWLPAIEHLLNDPFYAHTFSYLTNVMNDPLVAKTLTNQPHQTPAELVNVFNRHLVRLVNLDNALTTIVNDMHKQMAESTTNDAIYLSNNDFAQLSAVQALPDDTSNTADTWLLDLLKQKEIIPTEPSTK